jgi:hypothetical protein
VDVHTSVQCITHQIKYLHLEVDKSRPPYDSQTLTARIYLVPTHQLSKGLASTRAEIPMASSTHRSEMVDFRKHHGARCAMREITYCTAGRPALAQPGLGGHAFHSLLQAGIVVENPAKKIED